MQRIYVTGGSNSLMRNGWVSRMKTAYEDRIEVENLSIGAATSLMAILRVKSGAIPDGSTVVWEYALNESNHFKNGQSAASLMYNIDWLLTLCARRSIKVVPLIFWTKVDAEVAETGEPNQYYKDLFALFESRGISPLDFGAKVKEIASATGVSVSDMYENGLHYVTSETVMDAVCELVVSALDSASVPEEAEGLKGKDLTLIHPESEAVESFKSGAFAGEYAPVVDELRIPANGLLLASYVVASQNGGGVEVAVDDRPLNSYSLMTPQRENPPFRLIKHLVHANGEGVGVPVENSITVSRYQKEDKPIIQNMFAWYPNKAHEGEKDDGFISALVEV